MIKATLATLTILAASVSGGETMKTDPSPVVRVELKRAPTTEERPATALDVLVVSAEIESRRPAASGIRASVVFANKGAEPVRFMPPGDTTFILLLDKDGWPIEVPRPIPRSLDDRRRKPADEPRVVTLAAGEETRISVVVTQGKPKGAQPGELRMLAPGTYQVRVVSMVVTATDGAADGKRESISLQTELVSVELTEAAR